MINAPCNKLRVPLIISEKKRNMRKIKKEAIFRLRITKNDFGKFFESSKIPSGH